MATQILRPNGTLQAGSTTLSGGATLHAVLSDNSDASDATPDNWSSLPFGNGTPPAALGVVSFTDATGTIPAGRVIQSVACIGRYQIGNMNVNGTGYAVGSFRYSDNVEITQHDNSGANPSTVQQLTSGILTSATRWDAGTSKGAWTFALVDGIKAIIGAQVGASQSPVGVKDFWLSVVYTDAPGTPTSVTPANGANITVPNPALGGTMAAIATGQSQKMEWQFATDTGFTANVKTVTEASGDLRASGATTESPTIANLALSNGTWYMRARAIDQYGVAGSYSATATLTVNVPIPPTPTVVIPASASTVTTMVPTLGATLGVDGVSGRTQKAEWTLATDSGFTANVRTITELDADFRASGATTEVVPIGLKITMNLGTTWYIRARSIGNDGSVSNWTAGQSFTLTMPAPAAPTSVTPANGATLATNTPTLGATLAALSESRTLKAEWLLATDSGFTANVRTITEGSGDLRASGATTEVIPIGNKLFQSLWYMKARAIDQYGQTGAYSASQTFTVAHQPTASPTSPIGDVNVEYVASPTFTWSFSDPASGDTQSAYQIIIERNDTAAVVYDSNKVTSSASSVAIAISGTYKDIKLRWKIRVWDADDVVGNYSPYQLFTLSDLPVVTITAPTNNQQITTGQPTVTWTNDGATTQTSRRLVFKRISSGATIFDTGTVNTTATTYTTPNTILENNVSYSVTVYVTDTLGMTGSAIRNFSTLYQSPDPVTFTVDASGYESNGYINIDWSTTPPDGYFVDWRVYRRLSTGTDWELQYISNNTSVTHYHDWTATTGDSYVYAVSQTAGRSGVVLESVLQASAAYLADGTHYWIINPLDETDNLRISNVVADTFSDEYEEQELIIIGRGRKVNQGTRYGYTGTLSAQFRDDSELTARQKRLKLQLIKSALTSYYLRNPFGDILEVALGNLEISRIAGVGVSEYVDVTIPYREVF